MVQHGVADDEVELAIREGKGLGVGRLTRDVEAKGATIAHRHVHHALADVGDDCGLGETRLHEIESEEAGAGADLEHALGGPSPITCNVHVAIARVRDAALVVGDAPLLVVRGGLPVVVDDVGHLGIRPGFPHA